VYRRGCHAQSPVGTVPYPDPRAKRPRSRTAPRPKPYRTNHLDHAREISRSPLKASKEVEAKRQEVAYRIANGDKIATIQVRNQQAQRVREVTQEQAMSREGRTR